MKADSPKAKDLLLNLEYVTKVQLLLRFSFKIKLMFAKVTQQALIYGHKSSFFLTFKSSNNFDNSTMHRF